MTRNHGYLVYDTLFGTDANHQIKPQMVENTTISPNGMKYTFALRDGLEWAQDARLLRAAKGRLLPTRRATALLEASGTSDLFRTMFETAFWRINLAYFDRLPIEHWPQTHIGVVLWSLSVAAHDWTKPEELLSACTMPEPSPCGATRNVSLYAMITRVLRPATWFGLLECKQAAEAPRSAPGRLRLYRKTPLFDRLVSFDVELKPANDLLH